MPGSGTGTVSTPAGTLTVSDVVRRVLEQLPKNKPIRGILDAVKKSVDLIRNRGRWSFFHKIGTITLVAEYSTGTVTIAADATSITGSGTTWTSAMTGRKIRIGTDPVDYTFTYASGTTGTISPANVGGAQTAATYTIYQDTYALASDVQSVIAFYDVTNQVPIDAVESSFGQQYNNWYASTYGYAGSVFQFGRDSSNYYNITFAPPVDTAGLIRYLYYRMPTRVTGPNTTLDMPSEMDEVVIQGALWFVMKSSGIGEVQDNHGVIRYAWKDEYNLFKELLEGRWQDDRAFLTTAVPLLRWDNSSSCPWHGARVTLVDA